MLEALVGLLGFFWPGTFTDISSPYCHGLLHTTSVYFKQTDDFLTTCARVKSLHVYLHFLKGEDDERDLEKLEEKIWEPSSSLSEKQIDQFLVVAR